MQAAKSHSSRADGSSSDKLSTEVESLKDGLGQLRSDVAELFGHALGVGRSGVAVARDNAAEGYEMIKQQFSDLTERGNEGVTAMERKIKKHPWQSALIAFGIGFLAAKFFSRGD
jgi:ElaB/YqjD/DUF883 family membrane-anchored ribosome-binding protein